MSNEVYNMIDYEALADKIASKIKGASIEPLWDKHQCAEYFGVTPKHFIDQMSKKWGFPGGVILPSKEEKRPERRWFANEVQDWARSRRG